MHTNAFLSISETLPSSHGNLTIFNFFTASRATQCRPLVPIVFLLFFTIIYTQEASNVLVFHAQRRLPFQCSLPYLIPRFTTFSRSSIWSTAAFSSSRSSSSHISREDSSLQWDAGSNLALGHRALCSSNAGPFFVRSPRPSHCHPEHDKQKQRWYCCFICFSSVMHTLKVKMIQPVSWFRNLPSNGHSIEGKCVIIVRPYHCCWPFGELLFKICAIEDVHAAHKSWPDQS